MDRDCHAHSAAGQMFKMEREGQGWSSRELRVVKHVLYRQLDARLWEEMWRFVAPDLDREMAESEQT